jgi:DNA-binding transcriptional ArsR family regulator
MLVPTLWRTCRVLANPLRLRCLRVVIRCPGLTVKQIAAQAGLQEAVASLYLRQLQARGLIRAERVSRWVRYAAVADTSVVHAGAVVAGMRGMFRRRMRRPDETMRVLTAFTHPRRLAILRALPACGARSAADLLSTTDMSEPALSRHLDKLERHGLLASTAAGWSLARHLHPLAAVLLAETRR